MHENDVEVVSGWTPIQVARHYGLPEGLDGEGQRIAIIDLGELLDRAELEADFARLGLAMPEIDLIDPIDLIHLKDCAAAPPGDPAVETHIDVEIIASLCPAARIAVYRCCACFRGMAQAITRAVDDGVDVISISWGTPERKLTSGDIARVEKALKHAAETGVTVCASAGDWGASGLSDPATGLAANDTDDSGKPTGQVNCCYPGSSPQVLSCGGTELRDLRGHYHEVVWNGTGRPGKPGLATGGGVSSQFPLPEWQNGIGIASVLAPVRRSDGAAFTAPILPPGASGRIVPDVAAVAGLRDWTFFDKDGTPDALGGTSAVAPFYAAIVALAGQRRKAAGKAPLGFLNDRLYALAARGGLFTDITEGHNRVLPDGAGFDARPGFDACTGWGTPRIAELLNALADLP